MMNRPSGDGPRGLSEGVPLRRYLVVVAVLALASFLLIASPASATDSRVHVCLSSAPPGGSAQYIPGPTPNDDRCILWSVQVLTFPSGPPLITSSPPQPVGEPLVVTEQVVANCAQVNDPRSARPVEKCEVQDVTTTTQQTQVTITSTIPRVQQTTITPVGWSYPPCFPPLGSCLTGPLINPVPQGPPQVTTQPAPPIVQTSTVQGPPIVDVEAVTTGTCMKNPGSPQRGNACP